jgi:nitrogen regulatory protein PII 2
MKKIIAIIRNERVEQSRLALGGLGVAGVAVLRVWEKDRHQTTLKESSISTRPADSPRIPREPEGTRTEDLTRGIVTREPAPGYILRGMLITIVGDEAVLPVIRALIAVNQSGNRDDGEIFVCPMVTSLEIGTSECTGSPVP